MARISEQKFQEELRRKGLTLHEQSEPYRNLNTVLTVHCKNKHLIQTNFKTIRTPNFKCSVCEGQKSKGFKNSIAPSTVPEKKGYRIIGIDNATQNMGISIFDDGKLVYYKLFTFTGSHIKRLNKIRDLFEDVMIPKWKPDFIQFEDVQFQRSYATYEVLIKLIGVCEMSADRYAIPYSKDRSNVWRSHFNINGAKRDVEKQRAIKLVKEMYNIDVTDDVAEAILIGKFRSDLVSRKKLKNLF